MFNKESIVTSLKLFIITAVAALCLATVNKVTSPVISANNTAREISAQREVLPEAADFTALEVPASEIDSVTIEKISAGLCSTGGSGIAGYVVTAVSNAGYGGDIKVMVGIDNSLKVTKIKILESSETAGLGANASKPEFSDLFVGAEGNLTVVKGISGENEISAISSATITSKAVTSCVNAALNAAKAKSRDSRIEETVQKLDEIKQETEAQISKEGVVQ